MNMNLKAVSITRDGSYYGSYQKVDPTKPLRCTVEVEGPMGKTELNLPPETGDRIVALIADELAAQSRQVAEAMTAQFFDVVLPAPGDAA
jgi:hypothetical protein